MTLRVADQGRDPESHGSQSRGEVQLRAEIHGFLPPEFYRAVVGSQKEEVSSGPAGRKT